MTTMNRRHMFTALTAAGIAPFTADLGVAHAFGDEDYIRERKERLVFLENYTKETAARANAKRKEMIRVEKTFQRYLDVAIDTNGFITMTREDFKLMADGNYIDYIPDAEAKSMIPTFCGRGVVVPGTALA